MTSELSVFVSEKGSSVSKHKRPAPGGGGGLQGRIQQAMAEGRFQNALELARQHYKHEPTPANRLLLFNAALGRARQLTQQGATRDAAAVLKSQLDMGGITDAMKPQLAELFALAGDSQGALKLVGAGDREMLDRILATLADTAVRQQKAGRNLLPDTLRPDFDRILLAFEQVEAGKDDAARDTLQPIGLRSPFLEWKLYLRGLQAYYLKDDARAIENWQRLKAERIPARLAAPLRFQIDNAFRAAQPPETQNALQRHTACLQTDATVRVLRDLSQSIGKAHSLAPVFRQAETALQALRRDAPHLVPRLASALYWTILSQGLPEDIQRYQRVFGSPPDDPHFHRLEAMAYERAGDFAESHRHWQALEKEVAARADAWPGEQGKHARALIWQHMARNAAIVPDEDMDPLLPPFLRDHPSRPKPLKPDTEACFRAAIELAPQQADSYRELFAYLMVKKKTPKAIAVAKEMLKHFPNDVQMLTRLGEAQVSAQKYDQAVETYQQALKHNPLDRNLRHRLANAHLFDARGQAEAGDYDAARASYAKSLELDISDPSSVYCKWAACEIKAGDKERGEELIQKALAGTGNQLALSYSMVIEAIRLKLPAAVKKRFDTSFKTELAAPFDPAAALHLADLTASHVKANVDYTGQKTHQKKVTDYLKKGLKEDIGEEQLEGICEALVHLDAYRLSGQYLNKARRAFDANPLFPLLEAEIEIQRGPGTFQPWRVGQSLKLAEERAQRLPPGPKRDGLLDRIHEHQKVLDAMNPFGRMFESMFDRFDPFGGFDEDDDEYEDDGW